MKFADLHLHTIFSDGTYSPKKLISESIRAGLSAIAIADHDTTSGIAPVLEEAKEKKIEVLEAIELSAECEGAEIHILGYLIDAQNKALSEKLAILKKNRIERIYKIVEKLKGLGINLDPQLVFDIAGIGTAGRLHIARAMVKADLVSSTSEAFQKYIGDKGPAYVLGFRFSPVEAIRLIKEARGIPVLAHPYTLRNDRLLLQLITSGLEGLEVYYPEHSQALINFYLDLAGIHNLLVTGGSDCHGDAKPEIRIGSIKIPYELVEKLKQGRPQK